MKTKSKISGYIIRSAACAVFLLEAVIAFSWAFNLPDRSQSATNGYDTKAKTISQPRAISFAERVAFQRAIEDVYWRHRIWLKERPDPKPSLDAVMSQAQLEKKVTRYLHDSLVLEDNWQKPITADQLQAEMDRMARDTKAPDVLRELFEALGNDPAVIAECLARPLLAESLIADLSAQDHTPGVESPRTDTLRTVSLVTTSGLVVYTLPEIADPLVDTWSATTTANAPSPRGYHTAVWTGSEMIVWGGYNGTAVLNTGGRYSPSTDSWTATSTTNAPLARDFHTAVWTGSRMVVWGGLHTGIQGGKYNPLDDTWEPISYVNQPPTGYFYAYCWTGFYVGVWGGVGNGANPAYLNTGGLYDPSENIWTTISNINSPEGRQHHTAVSTGGNMIIWGGAGQSGALNTGGRYNVGSNSWTATTTVNAPLARQYHTAVWTGSEMIVWGGWNGSYPFYLDTGGRYNPTNNSWTATSTTNAPAPRQNHTAVWTGSEMIVWGGDGFPNPGNTGGRYNPSSDSWTATSTANAPSARIAHTAVWTGSRMIVWGGTSSVNPGSLYYNTGAVYYPGPSAPSVTTNPATNVASASATLNGSVNPQGLTTTVYFQYGTTTSYGHNTATQSYNGNTTQNVSANISGLTASTTYHFRIVAQSSSGTSYGSDRTFTSLSATGPPVVTTNAATLIGSYSATLNGTVDPHGLSTTVYFQYGTTTGYGHSTASQTKTGNTYQSVSANISGLSANTTYHFRIVATNTAGTRYGGDRTFTTLSQTGPPVVTTNPATNVASFSATLNGTVDPHGLTTTVYFQYGTTTSYGHTTANQGKSGNTYQSVSANISGLSASTTYHFRIVASNSGGTRYGSDRTFTTLSATGPPVVTTNPATNVASFSGTLNGTVDPHGLTTTVYFQYGTTTSYGHNTANQTKSGNTYQSVSANISGLAASTTYHFRIVASNSAGTVYGSDRTFTTLSATGPPVVITNPATNVANSSATLNGSVDPHGLTTTVYFQYGTTTSYGHTTANQTKSGNTYQSVSASISGLAASTTYHFRIAATNTSGTRYGSDRTFTTTP